MKSSETIFFVVFVAVTILIFYVIASERLKKRRVVNRLKQRLQYSDEEFGRRFYLNDPARAEVAGRVRKVLAANLEMPLAGLTPTDRLETDLNAELPLNPDLFWDLEN